MRNLGLNRGIVGSGDRLIPVLLRSRWSGHVAPCSISARCGWVSDPSKTLAVQLRRGRAEAELNQSATPIPVELAPQEPRTAFVVLQWFNWCGPNPGKVSAVVTLPNGSRLPPVAVDLLPMAAVGASRCDSSSVSSFLTEGPVQIRQGRGEIRVTARLGA
jgi:hypothetical protein